METRKAALFLMIALTLKHILNAKHYLKRLREKRHCLALRLLPKKRFTIEREISSRERGAYLNEGFWILKYEKQWLLEKPSEVECVKTPPVNKKTNWFTGIIKCFLSEEKHHK